MRQLYAAIVAFLLCGSAFAELDLPSLQQDADAFREQIISEQTEPRSVTELLQSLRAAEDRKATADGETLATQKAVIDSYKALAAQNPDSYRAWLGLAKSLRSVSPFSTDALAAAYNAYRTAGQSDADRLESLLLLSTTYRATLEEQQERFAAAQRQVERAEEARLKAAELDDVEEAAADDDEHSAVIKAGRDTMASLDSAMKDSVFALGKTFDEVSTILGGIDLEQIRQPVASESTEFRVARRVTSAPSPFNSSHRPSDVNAIDITTDPVTKTARACIGFTQPLRQDLNYSTVTALEKRIDEKEERILDQIFQVEGTYLCLAELDLGSFYSLELKANFPSLTGIEIGNATYVGIDVPDLPQNVSFSGDKYVLPSSGTADIRFSMTNAEGFSLDLLRITDRTLYRHLALGHVGSVISATEREELIESFSDPLWEGKLALVPREDVFTNAPRDGIIPVSTILAQRQRWLAQSSPFAKPPVDGKWKSDRLEAIAGVADPFVMMGRFVGDPLSHQYATVDNGERRSGVYVLLTPDLSELATDESERCGQNCGYLAQWFVYTDIGLSFYETDSKLYVIARSLMSGKGIANARIELVSRSNRLLASSETDLQGVADFDRGLTRGIGGNGLVGILAHADSANSTPADFSFIEYGSGRLDLSRLGVDGRTKPPGYDAFVYSDRGIYRPGEDIDLTVLIRAGDGKVPSSIPPLYLRIEANDRVIKERVIADASEWRLGGMHLRVTIPRDAETGSADIQIFEGKNLIGSRLIQIDYFRPDRARISLPADLEFPAVRGKVSVQGTARAEYLGGRGSIGRVRSETNVRLYPTESPRAGCYSGFVFGNIDDAALPVTLPPDTKVNDIQSISFGPITGKLPSTQRPIAASVGITLFDEAGPLASKLSAFPIVQDHDWIGVSKSPRIRAGGEPGTYRVEFDVVAFTRDHSPMSDRPLQYTLESAPVFYVWEDRGEGYVRAMRDEQRVPVVAGEIKLPLRAERRALDCIQPLGTTLVDVDLPVGRYVLTVRDSENGVESSVRFHTGSTNVDIEDLEPNMLTVSTDAGKQDFASGEDVVLHVESPFDGELLVALVGHNFVHWLPQQNPTANGVAEVRIAASDVKQSWKGQGVYAVVTVFRTNTADMPRAGPDRAVGAKYFRFLGGRTTFGVAITPDPTSLSEDVMVPGQPTFIDLELTEGDGSGLAPTSAQQEVFVSLYFVDVGLLSLTGNDVIPSLTAHFFGQEKLRLSMMDNYDRFLLQTGGDRPSRLLLTNYTSNEIVSVQRGPFKFVNGKLRVAICPKSSAHPTCVARAGAVVISSDEIRMDSGLLSIAAFAWSEEYVASASAELPVRSRFVIDIGAPQFVTRGDKPIFPLTLTNVGLGLNAFDLRVQATENLLLNAVENAAGERLQDDGKDAVKVSVPAGSSAQLFLNLEVVESADTHAMSSIDVTVSADTPLVSKRQEIPIRPAIASTLEAKTYGVEQTDTDLAALIEGDVEDRYDLESLFVKVRFSSDYLDALSALTVEEESELVDLPYLEQLIRVGLVKLEALGSPASFQDIERIVSEVQTLQLPDGSFLPHRTIGEYVPNEIGFVWAAGGEGGPQWARTGLFPTALTLDFLTRADHGGASVSRQARERSTEFLQLALSDHLQWHPYLACEPYVLFAALAIVNSADLDRAAMDQFRGCTKAQDSPLLADVMAAALMQQFGDSVGASAFLTKFANRIDQLEGESPTGMAMILNFLVEATAAKGTGSVSAAERRLLKTVGDAVLARGEPLHLTPHLRVWLARATDILREEASAQQATIDVKLDSAAKSGMTDGDALESKWIRYRELQASPFRFEVGPGGVLATVMFEGIRINPEAVPSLPKGALVRRFFNAHCDEIDVRDARFNIGEQVTVFLEANADALPSEPPADEDAEDESEAEAGEPEASDEYTRREGEPFSVGPAAAGSSRSILLVDVLPSSFQIVSENVLGTNKAVCNLRAVGNLRNAFAGQERIAYVIVPSSRVDDGSTAVGPSLGNSADKALEFRVGYHAEVVSGGEVVVPPLLIEAMTPEAETRRAFWQTRTLQVGRGVSGNMAASP